MITFRTALLSVPILGLLACGGGGGSDVGSQPAPSKPGPVEVLVLDQTASTRRLLGMASDGTGSVVLVPDASRMILGSLQTFRHADGVVYTLTDSSGSSSVREIRTVSLDGKTDRSLRTVDAATTSQVQFLGIRNGYLVAWLQGGNYLGPVEALPLAGGAAVVHGAQVYEAHLGASTLLYAETSTSGLVYRTAALGSPDSQASSFTGQLLTPLASGGWLMGSWPGSQPSGSLNLLSGDFAQLRELAPAGGAATMVSTLQNLDLVQPETTDGVFGWTPDGDGRRLMAFSRTGGTPIQLDGSSQAGWDASLIGLAGTRLVYQASFTDPATGVVQTAYRSVPVAGGTPVDLAPMAARDGDRVLGLTSTCLVVASPVAQETASLQFLPLDGTGGRALEVGVDWMGPQAWVLGDRVAFVVAAGATYQLNSVDASGGDRKTHLESPTALFGENPNGKGIQDGRMCFTRGNDLFLLDPKGTSPAVLYSGTARGSFAGWSAQRVFFYIQAPGDSRNPSALWSARPDGSDRRQLSSNASLAEAQ